MSSFHALHFGNLNKFAVKLSILRALSVCFCDILRVLFLFRVSCETSERWKCGNEENKKANTHKGSNKTHFTSSRDPNKAQFSFVFTISLWLFTVNHHSKHQHWCLRLRTKRVGRWKQKQKRHGERLAETGTVWKLTSELPVQLLKSFQANLPFLRGKDPKMAQPMPF